MPAGRPPHFESEELLKQQVDSYFIHIQGEKVRKVDETGNIDEYWERPPEPATITGLALYLGFESRQSVYDYGEREKFSYIIKNAQLRVECEYEKKLSGNNPTGSIFALKNMGWKDKTEQDLNVTGSPIQIIMPPDE